MSFKNLKLLQLQLGNATVNSSTSTKSVEQIHPVTDQVLRVYPFVQAAANFMGIANSNIHRCCNGKMQTCGGFKWRFYDGPLLNCKHYPSRPYILIYK